MRDTSPLDQFIAQQLAHGSYHSQGMPAHTSQSQPRLSPPLPTAKKGIEKNCQTSMRYFLYTNNNLILGILVGLYYK